MLLLAGDLAPLVFAPIGQFAPPPPPFHPIECNGGVGGCSLNGDPLGSLELERAQTDHWTAGGY